MGDTSITNNEVDNAQEDQRLTIPIEEIHRNVRLQSFINHYGREEPIVSVGDQIKHYFKKQCASLSLLCCLNSILDKIPLIRCLKEYNIRRNLFGDIIAGLTVAIMHIPQGKNILSAQEKCFILHVITGMAYGVLTTLPPIHGKDIL